MDLARLQREIREAAQHFAHLEPAPDGAGGLFVKAALQSSMKQVYILQLTFADYPIKMPAVYVTRPQINHNKHRYNAGNICYMHPNMWNPGLHDLKFVLGQAAVWLNKHEVFIAKGRWPGQGLAH